MSIFQNAIEDHIESFSRLKKMESVIKEAGTVLFETLQKGGKILVCGNGGSAADAQHFAAEIVGRFEKERNAWPCVSLTTDASILTAVANDYAYDDVFSRQVQGLGEKKDTLIGISTSGNSENVLRAVRMAHGIGMKTIGLLGKGGGAIKPMVDHAVIPWGKSTARIQESHIFILHFWALFIELAMSQTKEA